MKKVAFLSFVAALGGILFGYDTAVISGTISAVGDQFRLDAFFEVNRRICHKHGVACWTNVETFDRDMPIKFLPIKFDKMRLKLEAAKRAGLDKAITFEFSHFMSPQSMYRSAAGLYDRYREYMGI